MEKTVYTIGHSTHPIDEFIQILKSFGIQQLFDVRTIPRSRHNPQFNMEELRRVLPQQGVDYIHIAGLGGLRKTVKDSVNTAWKNASFRGFADYMQTPEFTNALDDLITQAQRGGSVIMCAEAVPWRCHRSLIGDALLARGFTVMDIFSADSAKPHTLTPWALVKGTLVMYPGAPAEADSTTPAEGVVGEDLNHDLVQVKQSRV